MAITAYISDFCTFAGNAGTCLVRADWQEFYRGLRLGSSKQKYKKAIVAHQTI